MLTNFKQVLTLASVTSTASQMAKLTVYFNLKEVTSIAYIKQRCHLCNEFGFLSHSELLDLEEQKKHDFLIQRGCC